MAKIYTILLLFTFALLVEMNVYGQIAKKNNSVTKTEAIDIADFEMKVFPNPVKSGEYVSIEFANFNSEKGVSISIINIIGKQLLNLEIDTANFKLQVAKEKFPAGIYILKAKQENKIRTVRLNIIN